MKLPWRSSTEACNQAQASTNKKIEEIRKLRENRERMRESREKELKRMESTGGKRETCRKKKKLGRGFSPGDFLLLSQYTDLPLLLIKKQ